MLNPRDGLSWDGGGRFYKGNGHLSKREEALLLRTGPCDYSTLPNDAGLETEGTEAPERTKCRSKNENTSIYKWPRRAVREP
jgi:hypothetical protein